MRSLLHAVVVEQVKVFGYAEGESGARVVFVQASNTSQISGKAAGVNL